jgi:hypothetical protein
VRIPGELLSGPARPHVVPEGGDDGFAYSFNEDGLLQIKVTLPAR